MAIYFREDPSGDRQDLYVQNAWPESGRYPLLKGAGRGKEWVETVYRADPVRYVSFDEFDGIYSIGFFGCNALAYAYPDNRGGFAGGMLAHVPSGDLGSLKGQLYGPNNPPESVAGHLRSLGGNPNNVWAVMAIAEQGHENNVREHIDYLKKDGVPDQRIKIILVKDQGFTFGLRYDGQVGQSSGAPKISVSSAKQKSGKGCCYISTAACVALGMGDDCEELRLLRRFRDELLIHTPQGMDLVQRYYETAPEVVVEIDRDSARTAIYAWIYQTFIIPAVAAARRGDVAQGLAILTAVISQTERRFLR